LDLASALLTGVGGEVRFEPRRAQELLDEAERLWRLSRPWTAPFKRVLAEDLKSARDQLRQSVAAAPPGASLVPVIFRSLWTPAAGPGLQLRCDGCGQTAVELKKCSRCRAAAYCRCCAAGPLRCRLAAGAGASSLRRRRRRHSADPTGWP
jgi:hypothetical protein